MRQQAHDQTAKTFNGSGVVRGLGAGQWFTLNDHPAHENDGEADRRFVVLSQTVIARNTGWIPLQASSAMVPVTGTISPPCVK